MVLLVVKGMKNLRSPLIPFSIKKHAVMCPLILRL